MKHEVLYRRVRATHEENSKCNIKGQVTKNTASRLGSFPEEVTSSCALKEDRRKGTEPVFQPMGTLRTKFWRQENVLVAARSQRSTQRPPL